MTDFSKTTRAAGNMYCYNLCICLYLYVVPLLSLFCTHLQRFPCTAFVILVCRIDTPALLIHWHIIGVRKRTCVYEHVLIYTGPIKDPNNIPVDGKSRRNYDGPVSNAAQGKQKAVVNGPLQVARIKPVQGLQ